jgi:hypothetical protein
MGLNMSSVVRYVQKRTGYPRFKFITEDEIAEEVVTSAIPTFTHYFPYKTYFRIIPELDAVDENKFPGLFKIVPKDCDPSKIYDMGMVFIQSDIAMGGYPRDLGRTIYGGGIGITALLYNQLNINIMSMVQPQQCTSEYLGGNLVQLYPKRRWYGTQQQIMIELMVYHADDLHTIPNCYELNFRKLCVLYCKALIYDRYKDLAETQIIGGHEARTMIDSYSNAESDIDSWEEWGQDEMFKNPDRIDFFIV